MSTPASQVKNKRRIKLTTDPKKKPKHPSKRYAEDSRMLAKLIQEQAETIERLRGGKTPYDIHEIFDESPAMHLKAAELQSTTIVSPPDIADQPFTVEEAPNPFLIGKLINPIYDPQEWAKDINERLDKAGFDYFPKFPFVAFLDAGINSGKSNLLYHMCSVYLHLGLVQHLSLISPTVELDPTFAALARDKPPDTKLSFHTKLPTEVIDGDGFKFRRQIQPLIAAAIHESRFESASKSKMLAQLTPYSSIHHPHTDIDGTVHDYPMHVPPYILEPALAPYPNFKKWKGVKRFRGIDNVYQSDALRSISHPEQFAPPDDASPALRLMRHNLSYNKEVFNLQANDMRFKGKLGKIHFRDPPFENRLLVVDDAAKMFNNNTEANWFDDWITTLRHQHQSVFISAQKATIFSTTSRAQVTDFFLWAVRSRKEFDRIEEEFGSRVPHFEEVYNYCMQPTEDMPRPFMYINMRSDPPIVMRGFSQIIKFPQQPSAVNAKSSNTVAPSPSQPPKK